MHRLRTAWSVGLTALAVTGVALACMLQLEPDYGDLQTANDVDAFRSLLSHPGRALGAGLCDIVFAVGYCVFGIVVLRIVGGIAKLVILGSFIVATAAVADELENLLLIGNVVRRDTTTDGWIDAMRTTGDIKYGLIYLALACLGLMLGIRAVCFLRRRFLATS